MTKTEKYFLLAKQAAVIVDNTIEQVGIKVDRRRYKLGAVGIRTDGTIVKSRNLPTKEPDKTAHAEYRVIQKLDWGSTVYVVRVLANGKFSLARPCKYCLIALRLRGIKKCYYSISDTEYGVITHG